MKYLWSAALVLTGLALGLGLLCIAPFVAVAVFAARTLSTRATIAVIVTMWLGNQAIGYGALHYPHDRTTIAWGVVMLASTLAAAFVARRIASVPVAAASAFVVFEASQFAFAFPTGTAADFALPIDAQVLVGNLLGAGILFAMRATWDIAASVANNAAWKLKP